MLIEVNGDIVNGDWDYFVQQVNMKGVMGAGLAKQIRDKYPAVYLDYKNTLTYEKVELGHVLFARTFDKPVNARRCVCFFAQNGYGRDRQYTDYKAFRKCLEVFKEYLDGQSAKWSVAFPYGIGCGLAGGDWNVIRPMLEKFSENVKQKVYLVRR